MSIRKLRRLLSGAILTGTAVASTLAVTTGPAQAYGSLTVRFAVVDTGNCQRVDGTLAVIAESGGCRLNDSADGTYFVKDPGGRAIKAEVRDGSGMVAKFEFHPSDERFWYYDTRNDGDTVYGQICGISVLPCSKLYAAPGTSNVIDYGIADFDIVEDGRIDMNLYDDANGNEWISTILLGSS
ncbi:hypothetical protein AB0B74_03415 [Micromonospora parva]|uniref:hypothetical protein n=1 Tax=Micromonospora parva TaxID=1464048 RepID=UPI00340A2E27